MTIDSTLAERGARYGDFAHHAKIAQDLQDVARATEGWARLDAAQRQALTVICDKIARILSGDPNYADNWHDIQGYAKLVEDRLPKVGKAVEQISLPVVDEKWREMAAMPQVRWSSVREWVRNLKGHEVVHPSDLNSAERQYLRLKGWNV